MAKGKRRKTKPDDIDSRDISELAASDAPPSEMVDLEAFLAGISARLATAGGDPLIRVELDAAPVEHMQVIVFTMGDTHYAMEVHHVGEIVRHPTITHIPGLPNWVLGVTNLHGDIVSVIDLAHFLSMARPNGWSAVNMMIVAQAAEQQIGLAVDEVEAIYTFPVEQVLPPPFKVGAELEAYLRGAVEREGEFVHLLDCENLLLGPRMQQFA